MILHFISLFLKHFLIEASDLNENDQKSDQQQPKDLSFEPKTSSPKSIDEKSDSKTIVNRHSKQKTQTKHLSAKQIVKLQEELTSILT